MQITDELKAIVDSVPAKPGCYLMKDDPGRVIYVGKAINLRHRVRSYFHSSSNQNRRVVELVRHIKDIDWIVVGSELEALILEMNLIKRHRPKYNVRLKDDKRYPYIKVHLGDPFPKLTVTRRVTNDGSRYYGPYTSVWAVNQTLDVLRKMFPYLTCDRVLTGEDARACLYYDIKLCAGPCIGAIDQTSYRQMIKDLGRFLEGKTDSVIDRLEGAMAKASEGLEFERAAIIRDQLAAIERVVEGQKIVSKDKIDSDVIAFARDDTGACVQVFFIRAGKLIGREYFLLDGTDQAEDRELVEAFLKQFYTEATHIPQRVLLPTEIEEAKIIEEWLNQRRDGKKVHLLVPRRGTNKDLVRLATENASDTLASLRQRWGADKSKQVEALSELQELLELDQAPTRIECYDISNLQGTAAAGSMVVFEQGTPSKKLYRKFTIRTVQGQDDFASMEEVLDRRFRRWKTASEEAKKPGVKLEPGFGMLPNLLIVDGGKGQLGRAIKVLEKFKLQEKITLVGLAKKFEDIYVPDRSDPITLRPKSQARFLVQRIRDEAHRFALQHHRSRRRKVGLVSRLDAITGIGPARRKALIKAFNNLDGIKNASVVEIIAIPGITPTIAERLKVEL
ncbi:MAG: excinuclease ABC subunit UvrC [Anaerolineales bacterium]